MYGHCLMPIDLIAFSMVNCIMMLSSGFLISLHDLYRMNVGSFVFHVKDFHMNAFL